MEQEKAKIFLGEHRGLQQSEGYRGFRTFNFGNYFNEHKHSFGNLFALNEDTLAGGHSLKTEVAADSVILLIPVVGTIQFMNREGHQELIAAGQTRIYNASRGGFIRITNPFETELVNFLQVWINPEAAGFFCQDTTIEFDLANNKNQLVSLTPSVCETSIPFRCAIGRFAGRTDLTYNVRNEKGQVFVFILEGAFEVQNRLLHAKDGLALWNSPAIEAEALSKDAILLVIEPNC